MLALLSPAKTLDLDPLTKAHATVLASEPALLAEAKAVHAVAKKYSTKKLMELMGISETLAELNHDRFQAWSLAHPPGEAKQAVLTFAGDVYVGLQAETLTKKDLEWSQDHLAILSGLYGVLRPLDLMRPYRLEMGSKVVTRRGKDLYAFWGDRIAKVLIERVKGHADPTLVNLASNEYAKAVDRKALAKAGVPVLEVAFKEIRDGEAQIYALFAKKARGMMARHIIEARIDRQAGLKDFTSADYRFDAARSSATTWTFTRPFRTVAMAAAGAGDEGAR